jgi:hypothetical protein
MFQLLRIVLRGQNVAVRLMRELSFVAERLPAPDAAVRAAP